MACTVRRQRPQSAPAPHARATSLVVDAPHCTASVTVWLVTPLHRHTNTGGSSVRPDAHHVEEAADEQGRVGADARPGHPLGRGVGMVDPLPRAVLVGELLQDQHFMVVVEAWNTQVFRMPAWANLSMAELTSEVSRVTSLTEAIAATTTPGAAGSSAVG